MITLPGRCTVVLISAMVVMTTACAESRRSLSLAQRDTLTPPVCYALTLGTWKLTNARGDVVAGAHPRPEPWWQPPIAILLDAAPPTPDEKQNGWVGGSGNAVRPDGVAAPHWVFNVGTWDRELKGQVLVLWSGGYTVTALQFPALQQEPRGTLTVRSDDLSAPAPTCEVALHQKACGSFQHAPSGAAPANNRLKQTARGRSGAEWLRRTRAAA